MTTLTKVLIGAAAVATVATVAVVVKKQSDKKDISSEETTEENKEEGIIQRIKTFALKRAVRFLGWVALHMEQIEAAATIIGLVSTIISITGAIRDFVRSNDLNDKLDNISKKLDDMDSMYSGEFRALYEDHDILAHNQAKIAKAVGVPVKEEIA